MDIRDIHEFDSETGEELESSIKRSIKVDQDVAIEEGEALEQLKASDGFKVLQSFLSENIEFQQKQLLNATDLNSVIRQQEIIKSYLGLTNWIDMRIQLSKDLKEELQTANPIPGSR